MKEAGMHTVAVCLRTNVTATRTANRTKVQAKKKARFRRHVHRGRHDNTRGNQGGDEIIVRASRIRAINSVRWCT